MNKIPFSAQVLQSYDAFERFLYSPDAIAEIKKEAHRPYVRGEASLSLWKAGWYIVTSPLQDYYVIFVKAIGYASIYIFRAEKIGKRLLLHANIISWNFSYGVTRLEYGENLLVSTCNDKAQSAEDLHTHPPIDITSITTENFLNKRMLDVKNNQVHFDDFGGNCGGISRMFAHLYFSTRPFFQNPEQHLVAVTKIFTNGASSAVALWQKFQGMFLGDINLPEAQRTQTTFLGLERTPAGRATTAKKTDELFQRLEPGLYAVELFKGKVGHGMDFIKEKDCSYLLDPNDGLIALRKAEDLTKICGEIVKRYGSSVKVYKMTQGYFSAMASAA